MAAITEVNVSNFDALLANDLPFSSISGHRGAARAAWFRPSSTSLPMSSTAVSS